MFNFIDRVMKKNLLGWLAMATMLVGTGCSTDEVVNDYSPENAIEFGTYVGRDASSRVTGPTTTDNIADFGVFAYYTKGGSLVTPTTKPNFMNNQDVNKSGSAWEYSPVKYWPNNGDDKVTFFAYSPHGSNIMTDADATEYPYFSISDDTDFLWAQPVEASKKNINTPVSFTFQHVMSRIGFSVEAMVDWVNTDADGDKENDDSHASTIGSATEIVITKVTFASNASNGLANAGTVKWTKSGSVYSYSVTPGEKAAFEHELATTQFIQPLFTSDINGTTKGRKVTTTKSFLNNTNSYLMLVPQTGTVTVTVEYSVITKDTNLPNGYSQVDNTSTTELNDFTFVSGKAYNFCLHIGLASVQLSATVSEWDGSPTDVVVNVPKNTGTNP